MKLHPQFWLCFANKSLSVIQYDNVPAYSMNLANDLICDGSGGPYALPCGSACLQYTGLTTEEFDELAVILQDLA